MDTASLLGWISFIILPLVQAQQATTDAVCQSAFDWTQNAQGQPPCLVAAYLQGACGTGEWSVPLLPLTPDGEQQVYNPPNEATANICTCSGAVYNLMSACAACQGGLWLMFAPWATLCGQQGLLSLPDAYPPNIPVPSNTSIPSYANTDPRAWTGGTFNVVEARQIALGGLPPSFISMTTSLTPSSTFTSASTISSELGTAPVQHDHTGAIVGGAVGGLLGVALIVVILSWLLCGQKIRNRFNRKPPVRQQTDILRQAFGTPSSPPPLAKIVVPVPMRPYLPTNGLETYTANTHTGSVLASYPESSSPVPKESTEQPDSTRSDMRLTESGFAQKSKNPDRQNTNLSVALSLLHRVANSIPRRRTAQFTSLASTGSGTVMTSTSGGDSDTGYGNISRQNTGRRNVNPIPFVLPNHPEESEVVDISSNSPIQMGTYGLSAADEKRRLNPPGYPGSPPWSASSTAGTPRSQETHSNAPNLLLDLASGAATIGSEVNLHSPSPAPLPLAAMTATGGHLSLPSNVILPSPLNISSQGASSGVLDPSPIQRRPGQQAPNLRFTVVNPGRDIEM